MVEFIQLDDDTRRRIIAQISIRTGMSAKAIEKDWWVTLILKALFRMPQADNFIFKGGTSLSKAWKLIQRFSEDIDIALAPEAFGQEYKSGASNSYVKALKKKGCEYTSNIIKNDLKVELRSMGVPEEIITIDAEEVQTTMPDKDPQSLYLNYPSLYENNAYIADRVKIEFGVRSLREPFTKVSMKSIIADIFEASIYTEEEFEVFAVEPRKTFLEKLLLLHEKFSGSANHIDVADRQSRHLSDLVKMMGTEILNDALNDTELHRSLLQHRKHYVRIKGIEYDTIRFSGLNFIPPSFAMEQFRDDYNTMLVEMIYDNDAPDFESLIKSLQKLQQVFKELIVYGRSGDDDLDKIG